MMPGAAAIWSVHCAFAVALVTEHALIRWLSLLYDDAAPLQCFFVLLFWLVFTRGNHILKFSSIHGSSQNLNAMDVYLLFTL